MSARRVCHHCVGNPYLGARIRSEGLYASCDYCGTAQWVLSTKAIAEAFDSLFDNYFEPESDNAGAFTVRELVELIGSAEERITFDICKDCRYESAAELTERPLAEGAYRQLISHLLVERLLSTRELNRHAVEPLGRKIQGTFFGTTEGELHCTLTQLVNALVGKQLGDAVRVPLLANGFENLSYRRQRLSRTRRRAREVDSLKPPNEPMPMR